MRLVLVGPPGSGKGTQAEKLCERLGLTYIGTGDLLREAIKRGTPAGRAYEAQYARGLLAPDALVNELVTDLFRSRLPEKFAVDGYPRTYSQAIAFDALLHQEYLKLDAVLNFTVPERESVRRIGHRRICSNADCTAVYNLLLQPPKAAGTCDKCGHPLALRDDDHEETIGRRMREFHENAPALVEHYRRAGICRDVPATGDAEAVYEEILRRLM